MAEREDGAGLQAEVVRLRAELARAERRIAELEAHADIDPLLEILNRRGFERELARSLAYVKRYDTPAALIYIDLDGFKAVNDRYGHAAGDRLLKAVAAEIVRHLRASDVVGRLGGDELGVLLWNAASAQAETKARELERLIAAIELNHTGATLGVGASAGCVPLVPERDGAANIDAADRAMYARKRERRG
jgi:diguanylate cyclase (GGDEF)-like protein